MNARTDALIGSTTAEVARHGGVNIRIRWLRILREQRRCAHDLTGLTIAALGHIVIDPDLLQGMQHPFRLRRQAFDRDNLPARQAGHRRRA